MPVQFAYTQLPNTIPGSSWRNAFSPAALGALPAQLGGGVFLLDCRIELAPFPTKVKFFVPPGTVAISGGVTYGTTSNPIRAVIKFRTPPTTAVETISASTPGVYGHIGLMDAPMDGVMRNGEEPKFFAAFALNFISIMNQSNGIAPPMETGGYMYCDFAYPDDNATSVVFKVYVQKDTYTKWWNRIHVWDGLGFPREDIDSHIATDDPTVIPPEGVLGPSGTVVPPLTGIRVEPSVLNVQLGETTSCFVYPVPPTAALTECTTNTPSLIQLAVGADANPAVRQTWVVQEPAGSSLPAPVTSDISCSGFTTSVTINPPGEVATVSVEMIEDPTTENVTFRLTSQLGQADVALGGTVTIWVSAILISEDFFGVTQWRFMAKDPVTGVRQWAFLTSTDRTTVAYDRGRPIVAEPMVDDVVVGFTLADLKGAKARLYFGYELNNSGVFVNLGNIWAAVGA